MAVSTVVTRAATEVAAVAPTATGLQCQIGMFQFYFIITISVIQRRKTRNEQNTAEKENHLRQLIKKYQFFILKLLCTCAHKCTG